MFIFILQEKPILFEVKKYILFCVAKLVCFVKEASPENEPKCRTIKLRL